MRYRSISISPTRPAVSAAMVLLGVHLPSDAFADPHDLSGQGAFALTGLTSSAFSFSHSAWYNLVLDLDALGFASTVTVVPLPPPPWRAARCWGWGWEFARQEPGA